MRKQLPAQGIQADQLRKQWVALKVKDLDYKHGRAFSYVYETGTELTSLLKEAYTAFFSENALNPMAFPGLRQMETDVVQMGLSLFQAPDSGVGHLTSGGTESILMAVKASKAYMMDRTPSISRPNMVIPKSAHPAFHKAAHYFDIEVIVTDIGPDFGADVTAIQSAINDQTVLVVASAPSYPQGVVDPITEIAALAQTHVICCHVDACVGGFILPFVEGNAIPFDFSIPGVTSMSADIHKYGFASKGASLVLYRHAELRKKQFYIYTDWPGGIYASPSVAGTRAGGPIAVAWTVMNALGMEGYGKLIGQCMDTAAYFINRFNHYEDIYVVGQPDLCVFSIGSDQLNIYEVGDEMHLMGWMLDRQQDPESLHLSISPIHQQYKEAFFNDFEKALTKVRKGGLRSLANAAQVQTVKGLKKVLPNKLFSKIRDKAADSFDPEDKRSAALYGMMGDLKKDGDLDLLITNLLDKISR